MRHAFLAVLLALAACDSGSAVPQAPDGRPPVVASIEIRDGQNYFFGVLSAASAPGACSPFLPARIEPSNEPVRIELPDGGSFTSRLEGTIYPNPSLGPATFRFLMPAQGRVVVYAVPASGPGQCDPPQTVGGAVTSPYGGLAAYVLLDASIPVGNRTVQLGYTPTDEGDVPWPAGYYRIYADTPGGTVSSDFFLATPATLPDGLCVQGVCG